MRRYADSYYLHNQPDITAARPIATIRPVAKRSKRVFFSFHYADVWRAHHIRDAWTVRGKGEPAGVVDATEFQDIERRGTLAVERWCDRQLEGTSVTAVLIGAQTAARPYVHYQIRRSYVRGNGLLGIWIDSIKDLSGATSWRGANPFDKVCVGGPTLLGTPLSRKFQIPVYDWVFGEGGNNLETWIDNAPRCPYDA